MASYYPTGHRIGVGYTYHQPPPVSVPSSWYPSSRRNNTGYIYRSPSPVATSYFPTGHRIGTGYTYDQPVDRSSRSPSMQPAYHQDSWWFSPQPRYHPPPPPPPPPRSPLMCFFPAKKVRRGPPPPPPELLARMPRRVPGDVPGSVYLMPANRVNLHIIAKGTTLAALQGSHFQYTMRAVACSTPANELIEMLGGGRGWQLTEVFEVGAGTWYKGDGIVWGSDRAKQSLEAFGWGKVRGTKDGNPVWVMLERVQGCRC